MDRELEDQLYGQVAKEVAENNYFPAPMARATEKSGGNADLAKSLYIKFRVEQLAREVKQEVRRQQLESEQLALEVKQEVRRQQLESEQLAKTRQLESKQLAKARHLDAVRLACELRQMGNIHNHPTILCISKGRGFDINATGHSAKVEFKFWSSQGSITIDGKHHKVQNHGIFNGRWTLEAGSDTLVSARKSSTFFVFNPSYDLTTSLGDVILIREKSCGRAMLLEGSGFIGVIAPADFSIKRASITGQVPDFSIACFAFWLSVFLWRGG